MKSVSGPYSLQKGALLDIWLSRPGGLRPHLRFPGAALVDSGSTVTWIHPRAATRLGLQVAGPTPVRQHHGSRLVPTYVCLLDLGDLGAFDWPVREINAALTDFDLLLGRDLLMRWTTRLDGPRGIFEIITS